MNLQKEKILALKEAKEVNAFPCCSDYLNLELFQFYPNVKNEYELAIYVIEKFNLFKEYERLNWIDFDKLGRIATNNAMFLNVLYYHRPSGNDIVITNGDV